MLSSFSQGRSSLFVLNSRVGAILEEEMDDGRGRCLVCRSAYYSHMKGCITVIVLHIDSCLDAQVLQQACHYVHALPECLTRKRSPTVVVQQGGVRAAVQQGIENPERLKRMKRGGSRW